jgi:hypothetical protein
MAHDSPAPEASASDNGSTHSLRSDTEPAVGAISRWASTFNAVKTSALLQSGRSVESQPRRALGTVRSAR